MISREFKAFLAVSNSFHRHSSVAPTECVSRGLESCCQNLARKTQFCTHMKMGKEKQYIYKTSNSSDSSHSVHAFI